MDTPDRDSERFESEGKALSDDQRSTADEPLRIAVHEEVLVPSTRAVEVGTVRIHKHVESVPVESVIQVSHDEVSVERVTLDKLVAAMPETRREGETLVIPVVEEVLVTEKRLMLREEIRITRRPVTQDVPIRETVQREVIEIEDPDGSRFRASGTGPIQGSHDETGRS